MIKLTINPDSQPQTLILNGPSVIIGSGMSSDLQFPELKEKHALIQEQDGRCIAINISNDPFAALNGLPFGKKALKSKDRLQIGDTVIQFEEQIAVPEPQPTQPPQPVQIEPKKIEPSPVQKSTPKKEEPIIEAPAIESKENLTSAPVKESISLVTTSTDADDPPQAPFQDPPEFPVPQRRSINRKAILTTIVTVIFMICLVLVTIFVREENQSYEDRLIAAEGVSDVAMAIFYAQVNHIKPLKQSWVDPEFLTNNLASILSPEYPSFAFIDKQGQFRNCPYLIRIYTNSDLSQFLIIAQPNPSWLQWFVSKAAIVVDSQSMEMHNIYDLKVLNRLLVNANSLDGTNASDVFHVVQQAPLIPLTSLGAKKGFVPPKALELIRPGAENRIYNSPRYYHFGESILKKALTILQASSSHETMRLQLQVGELSKFPDIVLYSSQGLQKAIQAQKALTVLVPDNNVLTAYLSFNKNGTVASSHLLFEGDYNRSLTPEASIAIEPTKQEDSKSTAMLQPDSIAPTTGIKNTSLVDQHHPLLLQLTTLSHERQKALKEISGKIIELLKKHDVEGSADFSETFTALLSEYNQLDQEWQSKVAAKLGDLYREYNEMPLVQFAAFIKTAGLELLAQESLRKRASQMTPESQVQLSQINEYMQKIEKANNFKDLDQAVTEASYMLNLSHVPDPTQVISYQNELRIKTLQQLRQFLLSSTTPLTSDDFRDENRSLLSHTLTMAWVTDPDEYGYYLNEFDVRVKQ